MSTQVSIMATRVIFTKIEKCKDVDTSNNLYKLNTGSFKENNKESSQSKYANQHWYI